MSFPSFLSAFISNLIGATQAHVAIDKPGKAKLPVRLRAGAALLNSPRRHDARGFGLPGRVRLPAAQSRSRRMALRHLGSVPGDRASKTLTAGTKTPSG